MSTRRMTISALAIAAGLYAGGCAQTAAPADIPTRTGDSRQTTPTSLPHPEAAQAQATPEPAPLTAATPAIVIESDRDRVTPTPDPPAVALPTEQIALFAPGPNSQVTSPFQVAGWGGPSHNDRVQIRLLGEDGRLLSEGFSYLLVLPGNAGRFYETVPFEIEELAQAARLEVSTFSPRDRQLSHLATVNLTLLTRGNPQVHPALHGPEKLAIFYPRPEAIVSGGTVLIQGAGWVDADVPLTVTVTDHDGAVLGSTEVRLDADHPGELGQFKVEVAYEASVPQWGRIAVAEPSAGPIPGLIHYNSVEVWLRP